MSENMSSTDPPSSNIDSNALTKKQADANVKNSNFSVHVSVKRSAEKESKPTYFEHHMIDILDDHLNAAIKIKTLNAFTLSFVDAQVEQAYLYFFLKKCLLTWQRYALIAIMFIITFEATFLKAYSSGSLNTTRFAILNGAIALLPMTLVSIMTYVMPIRTLSRCIHIFSLIFILFLIPILTFGQYFVIGPESISPSIVAAFFILEAFSSTFFFRLRFIYSLLASVLVFIPSWFGIYTQLLWKKEYVDTRWNLTLSSLCIILTCISICIISFIREKNIRNQFISDHQFLKTNLKLQEQLSGLLNGYSKKMADLDSPLEKAIYAIKSLLASPSMTAENLQTLHLILACLNSSNIMTPELINQMKAGSIEMDEEQKKWILTEITKNKEYKGPTSDDNPSIAVPIDEATTPRHVNYPTISTLKTTQVNTVLKKTLEYNFPIFAFNAATSWPLVVLGHHFIVESGLLSRLKLPLDKFITFLFTIESSYDSKLTFHNSLHASDVLHGTFYLTESSKSNLKNIFTDLEILSLFVAAIVHDVDHPGVSNNFLIATSDPKALFYNDKSVLENHHLCTAFKILKRPECNFVKNLDSTDYKLFRSMIVDMILATDLAQHFTFLSNFKKRILSPETFKPLESREDRILLMQMIIKCSDVSNPTKEWPIYSEWIDRITTEFFDQGDQEKALGLAISPFCNRENSNTSLSQKSFINFIVGPLYDALDSWHPIPAVMNGLQESRGHFCESGSGSNSVVELSSVKKV